MIGQDTKEFVIFFTLLRSMASMPVVARESLLFDSPLRRRCGANSAAGPQGGGQDSCIHAVASTGSAGPPRVTEP